MPNGPLSWLILFFVLITLCPSDCSLLPRSSIRVQQFPSIKWEPGHLFHLFLPRYETIKVDTMTLNTIKSTSVKVKTRLRLTTTAVLSCKKKQNKQKTKNKTRSRRVGQVEKDKMSAKVASGCSWQPPWLQQ